MTISVSTFVLQPLDALLGLLPALRALERRTAS